VRAFLEQVTTLGWAKLRPLRNRRFESRLRPDPAAPRVLLSPHLDDAVIDCWSIVTGPGDVRVVNVFAGVPRPGAVAYFDRLAGASDSAAHVRDRIADDRDALGRAGRRPLNLGFLAQPYRAGRPEASFAALDAALAAWMPGAAIVYAPAALGEPHPDHELVRDYALALAACGLPVRLYADLPYCAVYGWPAWVTGGDPDPQLDIEAYWNGSGLTEAGAEVVQLDSAQAAAKLAAMRAYREFALLDRGPVGQLSNPAIHRYEVFWGVDEQGVPACACS
jgi:LmbE family N-acetylglucosaminyl deacetylase